MAGPAGSGFGSFSDPMNGTDILILINNFVVGHQRNASRQEQSDVVDYSSKIGRPKRVGYGRYSSSMSLGALWVPTASGVQAIKNAVRNAAAVTVVVQVSGLGYEQATAIVTGKTDEWPDQGEATIACDLEIDGAWTVL